MRLFRALLITGFALFTACGNSDTTKIKDLTETCTFTAQSMPFNDSYGGSANIQQKNQALIGTMTLSGSPCGTTETLQGSFVNNSLTLQEFTTAEGILGTLVGDLNKDGSLSGNYTSPLVGCPNGDFGTWKATKQ